MEGYRNGNIEVYIRNLCKSYKNGPSIVDNLSMNVSKGTIYGLLGASGCGKTTVLSCIVGLAKWNSGEVLVFGQRPGSKNCGIPGKRIGYMPQEFALCNLLTVQESIQLYGRIYNMTSMEIRTQSNKLIKLLELPDSSTYIGELSGGQKRRISLALALIHSPELLVLDEPTVGLDPLLRVKICDHLREMVNNFGVTIIITTHYTEEARFANTIGVIRNGRMLVEDTPSRLLQIHQYDLLEKEVSDEQKLHYNVMDDMCIPANGILLAERDSHMMLDKMLQSGQRIYGMASAHLSFITRYPLFFVTVLLLPSIQCIVHLLIIGKLPQPIKLGVVNNEVANWTSECDRMWASNQCDFTLLSCKFLQELTLDNSIILEPYNVENEAMAGVHSGSILGYTKISENYSQHFVDFSTARQFALNDSIEGSRIYTHLDFSQFLSGLIAYKHLILSYFQFVQKIALSCNLTEYSEIPTTLVNFQPVYGDDNVSYADFMIPGEIIISLLAISSTITAIMLIYDRKQGILQREVVAGITCIELMSSYLVSQITINVAQVLILGGILKFCFGCVILGPVWLFWVISLLAGLCGTVLGILLGIKCNSEVEVSMIEICGDPILLLLGAAVWPAENMMHVFKYVRYFLPNSLLSDSLRSVVLRGVGVTHPLVWPGLIVIIAWIVVPTIICIVAYKTLFR